MKTKYAVEFGNRRLSACTKLGWKTIKAKLEGKIIDLPIKQIESTKNVRTEIGDVGELMSSIKQQGLLQAIGVCHKDKINTEDFLIVNTIENIHRKDILPVELGKTCDDLHQKQGLSFSEISARLGITKMKIESAIHLYQVLPKEFRSCVSYTAQKNIRNKKGMIPIAVANRILNTRAVGSSVRKNFLRESKRNDFTFAQTGKIKSLLEGGISLKNAIKNLESFRAVRMELPCNRKVFEKLLEKYDMSGISLIKGMLNGKIPLDKKLLL